MDAREAIMRVLADEEGDIHWTVVWDRALRAGYIDPRVSPGARDDLIRELAQLARAGEIVKTSKGTYRRAG
ncbi:MAG TPA: hypothetical protein VM600_03355 [Actinomycetota bacterium]|nr:hypothetical protein [Actinomycetota bacterium]